MARKAATSKSAKSSTKKAASKTATKKKKTTKRKSRKKKAAEDVRMKAYWGVFNQALKRVALYEYSQKKQAEKKAEELSKGGNKSPHFVQVVKEAIEE